MLQILFDFAAGGFGELLHAHKGDAGLNPEGFVHTVAGDFVTHQVEGKRLCHSLAADNYLNLSAARPAKQVRDFGTGQSVAALIVHFYEHVTRTNSSLVRMGPAEGMDDHGF